MLPACHHLIHFLARVEATVAFDSSLAGLLRVRDQSSPKLFVSG